MRISTAILSIALVLLSAGTASADPPWQVRVQQQLAQMPNADALVTAALMQPLATTSAPNPGDAAGPSANERMTALLQRAQQIDPSSADIAALAVASCQLASTCATDDSARKLQALAPDNAFAWMPDLQQAVRAHKPAAVSRALHRMAQAHRYDSYWLSTLQRVQRGLLLVATPLSASSSADQRAVYATSLASTAIPAYSGLIRACRPDEDHALQRRRDCRTVGLMMQAAPTLLDNYIGAVLHRFAARDAADHAAAVAYTRQLDWLQLKLIDYDRTLVAPESGAGNYLQDILAHRGEAAGLRMLLDSAHIPVEPPALWVDHQLAARLALDRSASKQVAPAPH